MLLQMTMLAERGSDTEFRWRILPVVGSQGGRGGEVLERDALLRLILQKERKLSISCRPMDHSALEDDRLSPAPCAPNNQPSGRWSKSGPAHQRLVLIEQQC